MIEFIPISSFSCPCMKQSKTPMTTVAENCAVMPPGPHENSRLLLLWSSCEFCPGSFFRLTHRVFFSEDDVKRENSLRINQQLQWKFMSNFGRLIASLGLRTLLVYEGLSLWRLIVGKFASCGRKLTSKPPPFSSATHTPGKENLTLSPNSISFTNLWPIPCWGFSMLPASNILAVTAVWHAILLWRHVREMEAAEIQLFN